MKQGNPQQAEIAYAAGIWEGEGSTAIYIGSGVNRKGLVYAVSVWQSRYSLLNWLHARFNGGVYGRNGAGYGKNSRKVCGEWRVTGLNAYLFLKAIRPYTVFRNPEIDVMIEAWENRSNKIKLMELCEKRKLVRAAAETECDSTIYDSDATVRSAGTIQPAEDIRNDIPPSNEGQ